VTQELGTKSSVDVFATQIPKQSLYPLASSDGWVSIGQGIEKGKTVFKLCIEPTVSVAYRNLVNFFHRLHSKRAQSISHSSGEDE